MAGVRVGGQVARSDDELGPEHRAHAGQGGAFTGTPPAGFLAERGVTQVVVCGVATAYGAESTARHASELGFDVTLPTDAMTDMSAEAQENSVERVFPRLGKCGTTRDVLDRLAER